MNRRLTAAEGTDPHDQRVSTPWLSFVVIFIVFYFVQPYNFSWHLENIPTPEDVQRLSQLNSGNLGRQLGLPLLTLIAARSLVAGGSAGTTDGRGGRRPLLVMIILLIGFAWLSLLWSDDTLFTLKRLLIFSMLWLPAFGFAYRFSLGDIISLIIFITFTSLLLGLAADLGGGYFHPLDFEYRFSGVMHPNAQALGCALLLLASVARIRGAVQPMPKWQYRLLAVLALGFLVLARSRTSFGAALIATSVLLVLTTAGRRLAILVSAAGAIAPLVLAAILVAPDNGPFSHFGDALLLGRDTEVATLTGRGPMWSILLTYAAKRPYFGYGYDSFWTEKRMSQVMESEGDWVASDHSSYLNLALGLGGIGVSIFVGMLIVALVTAIRLVRERRDADSAFMLCVLLLFMIIVALETIWFQPFVYGFLGMLVLAKLSLLHVTSHRPSGPPARPDPAAIQRCTVRLSEPRAAPASPPGDEQPGRPSTPEFR